MPTFGEYEAVGDPIATTEERGHASTVWRAVKPGANDGREYAVKCYLPRRTSRSAETETLSRDRGLEFLEGIKDQRKAQSTGGRSLAPIHAFGTTDAGAWYVTDFFPRSNLKAWITKKGRVDSAGLRHVVAELVAGCVALKQSRGYSHGNLKVSNAFRAGKKGTFHQTPILLTDPYPAGPARELDSQNTELLGRAMDAEDLRSIGEILLQLVECRLLANSEDYNWPIAFTSAWKNLGKDGERWLQVCNQLLDGNRAPDAVSLESLAEEFRPRAGKGKMLLAIAATVVAIGALAGGFLAVKSASAKRSRQKFSADLQAAQQAHSVTNLNVALARVNDALERQPESAEATNLKREIETAIEREFVAAIQSADDKVTALTPESLNAAEQFLKSAEELKRQDPRVNDLRSRIAKARQDLEAEALRDQWAKALEDNLSKGIAEEKKTPPNWSESSRFYTLAATNAALLKDDSKRQVAESGLRRAAAGIQAQTGEQRLREKINNLITSASEARRAQNWSNEVVLLTEAKKQALGLTNDPISVEVELASAQRNLKEWQSKEAARKVITDLIAQGGNYFRSANWPAASNSFSQALTNAARIADLNLQEAAQTNLQATAQKWRDQRDQQLDIERRQREEAAYQAATNALAAGSFSQARSNASQLTGVRLDQLTQRINQEEKLWQTMSNHLAQARYDEILGASGLPNHKPFADLIAAAQREQRIWQLADQEFQTGTTTGGFRFLSSTDFTGLTNKTKFSSLASNAREELQQALRVAELLRQTNLAGARQLLASAEVREKASKEPFKTLTTQLAARESEFQQAETAFAKMVSEGERLFQEGKFADAQAEANEALNRYPAVSNRLRAQDLAQRAGAQITRGNNLQSARSALKSGEYTTVANLCRQYPNDDEFTALANAATTESTALSGYRTSFGQGNYEFISGLEGNAAYVAKQPFADLLREAKEEFQLLSELQSLQPATNWTAVLNRFATITQLTAAKQPFAKLKEWADGWKKAEEGRQVAQLQVWDAELEMMLVQFNVVRARATQTAKELAPFNGPIAAATYSNKANALESRYPASLLDQPNWLNNKSRRVLLAELKRRIANWNASL